MMDERGRALRPGDRVYRPPGVGKYGRTSEVRGTVRAVDDARGAVELREYMTGALRTVRGAECRVQVGPCKARDWTESMLKMCPGPRARQ